MYPRYCASQYRNAGHISTGFVIFTDDGCSSRDRRKKVFTASAAAKTIPYVLQPGDTLALVAEKYYLTVAQLKTLNQYRTFAHGFESVSAGDEIDVPAQSKSIDTNSRNSDHTELAQRAQQAGYFLQNSSSADSAKDLARGQALGAANSKANQEVASWLNGKGKHG